MRNRSTAARRAATATLAVLLAAAAGCTGEPPAARVPAAGTDTSLSPDALARFLGNGLRFTDRGDFGLDLAELLDAPGAPGGTALRVRYPAGSASHRAGGPEGGTQAYLTLPGGPVEALDLEYQVRFPPDFDFVKGGKLPGLYGGTVTSGWNIPDGTNGFSTRYMWRAGGDGEVYAYLPTSQEHGTSLGRGCWVFTPGRWTAIRQRVVLNSPGQSDGRVTVWQDGATVLESTGLRFRTTRDLRIEGLFFSTFFGGGDSSWATPVDQYADFAAFTLSDAVEPISAVSTPAPADCGTTSAP